jgi:hypothetical protein
MAGRDAGREPGASNARGGQECEERSSAGSTTPRRGAGCLSWPLRSASGWICGSCSRTSSRGSLHSTATRADHEGQPRGRSASCREARGRTRPRRPGRAALGRRRHGDAARPDRRRGGRRRDRDRGTFSRPPATRLRVRARRPARDRNAGAGRDRPAAHPSENGRQDRRLALTSS